MSTVLLQNIQQIQEKSDSHPHLFEQALWELLRLYNERKENEFIRGLAINSGPWIRWENFQKSFKQATEKFIKRFTSAQLEELSDNSDPTIDSFVRTYYSKHEKKDFCCHRDICDLAVFISKELEDKSKIPSGSEIQQFYDLALQKMHAFLYGMIALNILTDCHGFIPQELEDIEEEAEEHHRLSNNNEW